jgi:diaminopimelate epimerase
MTAKNPITLETLSGIKTLHMQIENGKVRSVTVDMGAPILLPKDIPVLMEGDGPVISRRLELPDGNAFDVTCVSMGNPHCVAFAEDVDAFPLGTIGPRVERHPWFPERVNAEFVQVVGRQTIRMRVWERGSGETLACGTGACASAVACILNGHCQKDTDITVHLRGGDLVIRWDSARDTVFMTGPAAFVCAGVWMG